MNNLPPNILTPLTWEEFLKLSMSMEEHCCPNSPRPQISLNRCYLHHVLAEICTVAAKLEVLVDTQSEVGAQARCIVLKSK